MKLAAGWIAGGAALCAVLVSDARSEQPEETIIVCNEGEDRNNNCECLPGYERPPGQEGQGAGCIQDGDDGGTAPDDDRGGDDGGGGGGGGGGDDEPPQECPADQVPDDNGGCRERTCGECAQAKEECTSRGWDAQKECLDYDRWQIIDQWCQRADAKYPDGTDAPVDWGPEVCQTECVSWRHGPNGEMICVGPHEVCWRDPIWSQECIDAWNTGMPGTEGNVGGSIGPIQLGETVVTDPTEGLVTACARAGQTARSECNESKAADDCIDECDGPLPPFGHPVPTDDSQTSSGN